MTASPDTFNFEDSLKTLSHLVNQLEKGDLPLEESLTLFEQGIYLTKECQKQLSDAELKVSVLMDNLQDKPWQETKE